MQKARKAINKAIQRKSQYEDGLQKSTTITSITCHGQGVYIDISRWYIGMMFTTNFTTNKQMARDKN